MMMLNSIALKKGVCAGGKKNKPTTNLPKLRDFEMSKNLNERLDELQRAENQICAVLDISCKTCTELENLPFVDTKRLQLLSEELLSNLQQARQSIVENIDAVTLSDSVEEVTKDGNVAELLKIKAKLRELGDS